MGSHNNHPQTNTYEVQPSPGKETLTQDLSPGHAIEISLDAEPIDAFEDDGHWVDVHAYVNLPGQVVGGVEAPGVRLAVSLGQEGAKAYTTTGTTLTEFDFPGAISKYETSMPVFSRDISGGKGSRGISPYAFGVNFLAPTKAKPAGTAIIHTAANYGATDDDRRLSPTIETADATETYPIENGNVGTLLKQQNKSHIRAKGLRSLGKRALVGVSLLATIKSGGIIDRAIEGSQDAGPAVHAMLQDPLKFNDGMILPEKKQLAEGGENHQEYTASVDRVADVMQKWDDGDIDSIRAQAAQFAERYADQLLPADAIAEARERLERSTGNQEALAALNDFMHFYDKDVQFLDHDVHEATSFDPVSGDLNKVQNVGRALIDALGPLPNSIIKEAKFKHVTIASSGEYHFYGYADSEFKEKSVVYIADQFTGYSPLGGIKEAISTFEPLKDQHVIIHEMGHGLDGRSRSDKEQPLAETFKYIGGRLINMPNEQSYYAANENSGEATAENIAIALSTDGHFSLASPDAWRHFNSGANAQVLAVERRFDAKLPGFAAYITATVIDR